MDKHIPCYKCGQEVSVTSRHCDKCGYEIQMMDIFTHEMTQLEEQDSETKKDSLSLSGKFLQKVQDILRKN
ncbi:MAG: hypothetical protein CL708_06570 [Chloroflexi bacterium]|nr:hypothetical protein [Chloroflexota bacterium]|tara:strand:- start:6351 stop:6563 length:213 start_codon:yes stop_codon:yes gene_type:complete